MNTTVHTTEDAVVAVLVQLIVIILAARLAGSAARAARQPRVVGEILAGLLLGPSLFGHFWPELSQSVFAPAVSPAMQILSQIGLILLMFQIGSDFEFAHLREARNKRAVLYVALASLCVPFATGFLLGWYTAPVLAGDIDRLTFSLFVSIALAITAVPTLGRILREYGLTRTEMGVIAITAAAANDVVGWVLLAGVAAFASAKFSLVQSDMQVAGIAALMLGFIILGRPLADRLMRVFPTESGAPNNTMIAIVLALIFAAGIVTQKLGIFTIFGGFLLGLLFHHHHAFVEAWRRTIGQFVLVFFLPIFFTYTGLRTDLLGLTGASDWGFCLLIVVVASAAKILPVYGAARAAGLPPHQSSVLGPLMNTRGLMELIVLNIGFSLGFVPQNVFTMLVIMAVATTIMTGPLLQLLLPRTGHKIGALIEA